MGVDAKENEVALRKRGNAKKEEEADEQDPLKVVEKPAEDEMDAETKEYIEYFRRTYGDNPRGDLLGIDGAALFCLIYVFIAGVVLTIIFFSMYTRHNPFGPNGFLKHWNENNPKGTDLL